jgi:transcriptional regulator with XRE-family HTH domain
MNKSSTAVKPTITYGALVGRIIEHRRKQLGLNQEPLATALGITQSAYSRLEKGQSVLTVTQLRMVAPHLKATAGQILDETDRYAIQFQRQGGEIIGEKEESSTAGLLVALGVLAALLAAK